MSGETNEITLRALAPLPPLSDVVFLRKESRDFVAGRGPIPAGHSPRVHRFFRVATAVFAIVGTALSLAALGWVVASGQPVADMNGFFLASGPTLLAAALIYYGINFVLLKQTSREQRLSERGGLLPGEVVSTRFRNTDEANDVLRLEYRFAPPGAEAATRKKHFPRHDLNPKSPPPPGSRLLILYVDEQLWQVL